MGWKLTVLAAILVVLGSFTFLFVDGKTDPYMLGVPYIFWCGVLATIALVVLTFIGSRLFHHRDS